MRLLAMLLLLSGCAEMTPVDVGPYQMVEYTIPACSKVTVSPQAGPNRWIECQVR